MEKHYDYVIIGSGPAGHSSAIKAAQAGASVAVIDRGEASLGGVCLNEGCIPAKSLYHDIRVMVMAKERAGLFGIDSGDIDPDLEGIVASSRKAVDILKNGLSYILKKNNIDLIWGEAVFRDGETLEVKRDNDVLTVKGKTILIATGSLPKALPLLPFDGKNVVSSSEAVRMNDVPERVIVVGGGAIGAEFSSFYGLLGKDVTIVEAENRLLPSEDSEISKGLGSVFRRQGITVRCSTRVCSAEPGDDGMIIGLESNGSAEKGEYDMVLVAIGRIPFTKGLELDKAGIIPDEDGFLAVDDGMRTSVNTILAAGDVVNSPMLAHMAEYEGEVAASTAIGGDRRDNTKILVPSVVYTQVETASIGMSEEKAAEKGILYLTGKHFFKSNGRAVANSESDGFVKIVAEKDTGLILGGHILGYQAAELIHELVVALKEGLTVHDLSRTVHAHPTLSETVLHACKSLSGKLL